MQIYAEADIVKLGLADPGNITWDNLESTMTYCTILYYNILCTILCYMIPWYTIIYHMDHIINITYNLLEFLTQKSGSPPDALLPPCPCPESWARRRQDYIILLLSFGLLCCFLLDTQHETNIKSGFHNPGQDDIISYCTILCCII